jgi:hypothetical protein
MDRLIPARVGLEGNDGGEDNVGDPGAFVDTIVGVLKE